ncbi:DUF917 family protein [Paraburkholderia aspalathi]|uniref:S-methyl thiohydantoin desulfurase domain-containing protein n=1 Tax=Paraburkholderia aspalathi TaxID=1324617 RepID=UPI003C9EB005
MAYELKKSDLEALLLGGAFFGCGGGGTLKSARNLAARFEKGDYYPTGTVRVVTVEEATVDADGDAVMVAYLGAPEPINKAHYPIGPVEAVRNIQTQLATRGRRLAYIAPPECGALGFVVACLVAAKLGLAVIDADGAGRAVPSLPMLTFAASNIDPRPAILVSQSGLSVELNVTPLEGVPRNASQDVSAILERMMRPVVSEENFGQFGGLAMWVMTPSQLPGAMPIRGTLSRSIELGRALENGEIKTPEQVIRFAADRFGIAMHAIAGPGEFVAASLNTAGGFDVGTVRIRTEGEEFTVLYKNESLIVWNSKTTGPVMLAPDSVTYFVEGGEDAIATNGDLIAEDGLLNRSVRGRKVTLLAWEAEPQLTVEGGIILESFMSLLASLGYHGAYVPVGALRRSK